MGPARALAGGVRKARLLDERAPVDTVRVATDGRTVMDIAAEVPTVTGWLPDRRADRPPPVRPTGGL